MFNTFAHVADFTYGVESDGTICIAKRDADKLVDYPALAGEIYQFVTDIAVAGTEYSVYLNIEKNKFGRVRLTDRVVIPTV